MGAFLRESRPDFVFKEFTLLKTAEENIILLFYLKAERFCFVMFNLIVRFCVLYKAFSFER